MLGKLVNHWFFYITRQASQTIYKEFEGSNSENSTESLRSLVEVYLQLLEKNKDVNFRKYSGFLKIFPQYFATNPTDFYYYP